VFYSSISINTKAKCIKQYKQLKYIFGPSSFSKIWN